MQTATNFYTAAHTAPVSATRIWVRRSVSAFATLFLLLDGVIKVLPQASVVEASAQLGYGADLTLGIGILELVCLAVYLLPRTAPLGALLWGGLALRERRVYALLSLIS